MMIWRSLNIQSVRPTGRAMPLLGEALPGEVIRKGRLQRHIHIRHGDRQAQVDQAGHSMLGNPAWDDPVEMAQIGFRH